MSLRRSDKFDSDAYYFEEAYKRHTRGIRQIPLCRSDNFDSNASSASSFLIREALEKKKRNGGSSLL
jgi:hypothetical protein